MRKFDCFVFLLLCQLTYSQTAVEKLIHGKISVAAGSAEGVNIVNLVNEKSTVSDSNGEFFILAKAEDLLVFSAVNLEYHRRSIEDGDLKPDIVIIKMIAKTTKLKEVIVNKHPEINSVSLGISPKNIKKYTPAERRLYTATSTPGDALLNYFSGRTEMLKKGIEVEKKERLLAIIDALYKDDSFFTQTLKIPIDYIKGFEYYCIEEKSFAEVLKTKNKTKIEYSIIPLAEKYNKIIADETK
jgi:hypothetical protein